jgi:multidrug efflux system outer membrane protein
MMPTHDVHPVNGGLLRHPVRWLGPLAMLSLAACSTHQPYERPDVPLPAEWVSTTAVTTNGTTLDWQTAITDERLRTLVQLALDNSQDLQRAAAQVRQLQAQFRIREAERTPAIAGVAAGNRQGSAGSGPIARQYTVGVSIVEWELDFFGRLQSLQDASLAQFLSSQESQRALRWSLMAGVAHAWLDVQTAEAQLELTRQVLHNREQSLQLIEARRRQGTVSDIEVWQARGLIAQARTLLAEQQRQRDATRVQLTLLVGLPLDRALDESLLTAQPDRPLALREVPAHLPSEVLLERPDVRAAEWQLAAAQAQIGAARAAFFPRITLTAGFGSASSELGNLLSSGTWGWTLAPQAVLPIFNAGANRAQLQATEAARDAALAQYQQAIQTAFAEVQGALSARDNLQQQWQAQSELLQAETERLRRVQRLLEQGVASRLEWLDAERSAFEAQRAWVQTRQAVEHNRVVLLRVLGG